MRRAYSLLELLVAAGLALLVLLFATSALVMASRAWSQAQKMGNVQRSTLNLAYRLRHDYTTYLPGSLRQNGNLISLISDDRRGWNASGEALYHHWVQYRYRDQAQTVERREVELKPPVTAAPPVAPDWSSPGGGVLLAEKVTLFAAHSSPSGLLRIDIRAAQDTSSNRLELNLLPQLYGLDGQ